MVRVRGMCSRSRSRCVRVVVILCGAAVPVFSVHADVNNITCAVLLFCYAHLLLLPTCTRSSSSPFASASCLLDPSLSRDRQVLRFNLYTHAWHVVVVTL